MSAVRFSGRLEGEEFQIGGHLFVAVNMPEPWRALYQKQRSEADPCPDAAVAAVALLCTYEDSTSKLPAPERFMRWVAVCRTMPAPELQKILRLEDVVLRDADDLRWLVVAATERLRNGTRVEN